MCVQSEAELEETLLKQLTGLGYARVRLPDAAAVKANLKQQLEIHNETRFSDSEFAKILNHLSKGNVFDKAHMLRDRFHLAREDGSSFYVEFLNQAKWCQNQYQVASQITIDGKRQNRYDITLLVNGLPLCQIELKRRGMELKEGFNQINRYQRDSYGAMDALFQYVQVFVISNGVNTKYYANNRSQSFKQTFFWADEKNNLITNLPEFADAFLEPCQLSKIICQYIVLHESDKILMVLRPYQYYAVEAIVEQVKKGRENGYIWHTTGSGKTLTSFKAAQILTGFPKVKKVVFVVDRADLDYQTTKEFNHFSAGSVDGTDNTKKLVEQFTDDTPLIVTTIQKLNTAISRQRYLEQMEPLKDQRIVFIFDECHRSQFGETHKRITGFFSHCQMFGFTGTPIFADNAARNELGKRTTKDLFGECLHRYVITNAINDHNVLKFSVEYWGKLVAKDDELTDEQVAGINTKEFFESPQRISQIVDWIIAHHDAKTHNRNFSAMLCVGSVDALITYYDLFKAKKAAGEHDLRVVTVFTYGTNEDDKDANGLLDEPDFNIATDASANPHTRDKLEEYMADYNAMYRTNFSANDSKGFYAYYNDISRRLKERDSKAAQPKDRADILLVVNMFLTGFDAKKVNTLYVDKNLKYHGLIQAFSRTNRILDEVKSQGNIVCFRNLKPNTDEAIRLFSDENAKEIIIMEPYEDYAEQFNDAVTGLRQIAPTVDAVNTLPDENAQLAFIKAFRNLMRLRNILSGFSSFSWEDLAMTQQEFEDYKSKYLDIYESTRTTSGEEEGGVSIINDVDFELELIARDEVNVAYILALLQQLRDESDELAATTPEHKQQVDAILGMLGKEVKLRSKRDLIEQFIHQHMPLIPKGGDVAATFRTYWSEEYKAAMQSLSEQEKLDYKGLQSVITAYKFTGHEPLRQEVIALLPEPPSILQRATIAKRIIGKIVKLVHTFDDDMGDV